MCGKKHYFLVINNHDFTTLAEKIAVVTICITTKKKLQGRLQDKHHRAKQ